MRCQLFSHRNEKADKKPYAYFTVALVQRQSGRMRDVRAWWKNIAPGEQNIDEIHAVRYIRRYLAHVCRMSAVFFISFTIWSFDVSLRASVFSRFSYTAVIPSLFLLSFLSFSFSSMLRPESCSCEFLQECKRRPGRLYELFQFTSANGESFLLSFFASPLSRAFALSLSLYLTSVYT